MPDIDRSVVEGLRRGQDEAYRVVIEALHAPVYRFILRLCHNADTAQDITQETFLAVWQGIESFRAKSQFKTWVFGIAYNQFLRHRDRQSVATVPLDESRDANDSPDPYTTREETEEMARVRGAVHSLPSLYRDVVCLVHLDGLSYGETAEVLGIPVGTVKSRMNSAFKLLREKLRGSEAQPDEVREPEGLPGPRTQLV